MNKWYLVSFHDKNRGNEIVYGDRDTHPLLKIPGGVIGSCSPGYDTEEALRAGQKILDSPCKCCGGVVGTNYTGNLGMVKNNLCFSCQFWTERLPTLSNPNVFIIRGEFYSDAGNRPDSPRSALGHGGRRFRIQLLAPPNTIIETNNLWHGGEIPDRFREQFSDNAVFLPVPEYEIF